MSSSRSSASRHAAADPAVWSSADSQLSDRQQGVVSAGRSSAGPDHRRAVSSSDQMRRCLHWTIEEAALQSRVRCWSAVRVRQQRPLEDARRRTADSRDDRRWAVLLHALTQTKSRAKRSNEPNSRRRRHQGKKTAKSWAISRHTHADTTEVRGKLLGHGERMKSSKTRLQPTIPSNLMIPRRV